MINYELLQKLTNEIGVALDEYGLERFDTYAERLVRWNNHINLTSITDPDEIVIKHFIDSLYILRYVSLKDNQKIADIGTGAGFPGMPLLIAKPNLDVTFVDSIGKRLGFIKDVLKVTGLLGTTVHRRAEEIGHDKEYRAQYDYVTARAVAPLNVLCEYAIPLLSPGGVFIAMKGPDAMPEITASENAIEKLGGKLLGIEQFELPNSDKRSLVFIKKISQTPTKYPRKTKKISTKPL